MTLSQSHRSRTYRNRQRAKLARAEAVEGALMDVLGAVRAYLPPKGIGAGHALALIIGAVDNPEINPHIAAIEAGRK